MLINRLARASPASESGKFLGSAIAAPCNSAWRTRITAFCPYVTAGNASRLAQTKEIDTVLMCVSFTLDFRRIRVTINSPDRSLIRFNYCERVCRSIHHTSNAPDMTSYWSTVAGGPGRGAQQDGSSECLRDDGHTSLCAAWGI